MKKFISLSRFLTIIITMLLIAAFLTACNKGGAENPTEESSEVLTEDNYDKVVMPVYSVKCSADIYKWESLPSSMTAVSAAEKMLPENIQSQYYTLMDITPQQFGLKTGLQIFAYGKEADKVSLNAVYVFVVQNGAFLCALTPPLGVELSDYSISAVYIADLNRDGTYEVYVNASNKDGSTAVIGANIADASTAAITGAGEYDYCLYLNYGILYLIKNPHQGKDIQKVDSMHPIMKDGFIADRGTASQLEKILAAQNWFRENITREGVSENGTDEEATGSGGG